MLSAQCGWVLSCLVVAVLHQRATASASAAPNADAPPPQPPPQPPPAPPPGTDSDSDTEAEAGASCYICVNVSDNLMCNRYAIDRPCPRGQEFCHTLHIMDSRGDSVVVNKKCADRAECSPRSVGCLNIDSQKVCVSCCDEDYCNEAVPTNHSTAVFSDTRTRALDARRRALEAAAGAGRGARAGAGAARGPALAAAAAAAAATAGLLALATRPP